MPQSTDLVGLGVPAQVALHLGNDAVTLTTTGAAQNTAATITSTNVELSTSGGATGAILPSGALIGTPYFVFTSTATTGVVYPPVGHYLVGALNTGVNVAQNKGAIFWQYKKGYWSYVVLA